MEDTKIVELFWKRDKSAITEVENTYHHLLYHIAKNITASKEDAEECVNDTYLKLWNAIPPEQPNSLKNYAARITRNLAIDLYRRDKKNMEISVISEELEGIFAGAENDYENAELADLINGFLGSLDKKTRVLFVRRYWQADSVKELSEYMGMKESAVKMSLSRTRSKFQKYLEKEGVRV